MKKTRGLLGVGLLVVMCVLFVGGCGSANGTQASDTGVAATAARSLEGPQGDGDGEVADDNETVVTLDALPDAVRATVLQHADASDIQLITSDDEDAQRTYDVKVIPPGASFEVAADGTFLGNDDDEDQDEQGDGHDDNDDNETVVTLDAVPDAARTTILQHTDADHIERITLDNEDGESEYEVKVAPPGASFEVAADGTFLGNDDDEDQNEQGDGPDQPGDD